MLFSVAPSPLESLVGAALARSAVLTVPISLPAVHLQVFLGMGLALLCLSILLGCAMCWQRLGPHLGWERATAELGPTLPARTVWVPIQQHYEEVAGEVLGAWGEEGPLASPAPRGGLLHWQSLLAQAPLTPAASGSVAVPLCHLWSQPPLQRGDPAGPPHPGTSPSRCPPALAPSSVPSSTATCSTRQLRPRSA